MVVSIEQHVEWIAGCMAHMRDRALARIDVDLAAQDAWVQHVNAVASKTILSDPGCNSWYLGANVPGKPRVFMPLRGFPAYAVKCEEVVAQGYAGFKLS
jgi:cyclohexanone monooxygenase